MGAMKLLEEPPLLATHDGQILPVQHRLMEQLRGHLLQCAATLAAFSCGAGAAGVLRCPLQQRRFVDGLRRGIHQ